jgi:3-deoxy-D-manno-octulosonate 8-phosphate phosphatase (KDO 8-P phosphatase)
MEGQKMKQIKYFVMDVDGTLTDGKIYISSDGEAVKAFNIKDGYGIHNILLPAHIVPVIITGRSSEIVVNRCRELGIKEVHQGVSDKVSKLREIVPEFSSAAYIGDDINDLPCMYAIKEAGGVIGCPADAVKEVKAIAHYIAEHNGGDGAVREFIEWLAVQ